MQCTPPRTAQCKQICPERLNWPGRLAGISEGAKGQLILKWFFGVIDFLQKTNKRIRLYYYDTSGRLVLVRFLGEIEDTKKTFRN